MADLSIIIATLNEDDEIEVLSALQNQTTDDYEVLIQTEKGASRARNEGVRRATSDKLVFLDDDSYPVETYLETVSEVLDDHALVAGRIIDPHSGILGQLPRHYDHGNEAKYVDMATGCNMVMRREVIESVGGFDEQFEWGHEETDLIERAKEQGYRVWYEPNLVVEHPFADSLIGYWRKSWHQAVSGIYYDRKHNISLNRRVRSCIPISTSSNTIEEFVAHSVAKGVGCIAKLYAYFFVDIPDHTQPKEPL
jgi:GT2 family glycosyltransferase